MSRGLGCHDSTNLVCVFFCRQPVKGVRFGLKRASDVAEILLGQVRQLALLSVRVAGLLSEEAGDQGFVVDQPNLEKVAELFDRQVTGK